MYANRSSARTRLAVRSALGTTLSAGLLAALPLRSALAQACVAWTDTATAYTAGEVVTYEGSTYTALQTYTNAPGAGWYPPATPALWAAGGACSTPSPTPSPSPTPTPTPTPTPSPTPTPTPTPTPAPAPAPSPAPSPSPTPAPSPGSYNVTGIYSDGSTFSSGGGLDGDGFAYSASLLGWSQTWNGSLFTFGPSNGPDAYSSTTIPLTQSQYTTLNVLATAVNGSQPSQTFTVTYTDGTTSTFTQSVSDWYTPQSYPGESVAVQMPYRDSSGGSEDNRTFDLYGYSFALDSSKTVQSVTLPANRDVVVLGVALADTAVGSCGTAGGIDYVMAYKSGLTEWCVDPALWSANSQQISGFFGFGDAALARLQQLFATAPPSQPFVIEGQAPFGAAHTGCDFGSYCDTITGDAYYNTFNDPVTGTAVPGYWGYLLTLHEAINVYTGLVSSGWPTDWWSDHRSPFPNAFDYEIMKDIGARQNDQTLLNAATAQKNRFDNPTQNPGGYDPEVAMDIGFFDQYGGFPAFQSFFRLVAGDGLDWGSVGQDPSFTGDNNYGALLSEYVAAYLGMGFGATSNLTPTLTNAGVGTLDSSEPSYVLDPNAILSIANAHCSIAAAAGAGVDVLSQLQQLQQGNYLSAMASGGTQSTCPSECSWNSSANLCVAKW
jgi:outer membrane biosynthesis protein TonB